MNRVISFVSNIRLRQILTVFLVGIAFFAIQAFGGVYQLQAQAEPVTPEAASYQVDDAATSLRTDIENVTDKAQDKGSGIFETLKEKVEEVAENVVEKLNLNEPLPPSTEKFLDQVEERVDDTLAPVTGNGASYK